MTMEKLKNDKCFFMCYSWDASEICAKITIKTSPCNDFFF